MSELDIAIPGINVASMLMRSMLVTGRPGCYPGALNTILDADGYTIEKESHIWSE